jgi:alpha/beta superfamily hydrolase
VDARDIAANVDMNSLLSVPSPVNTINALLSSGPGGAIILSFDSHTRIAGEMISGVVQLNFQQAQKENIQSVRIKFRGMAST